MSVLTAIFFITLTALQPMQCQTLPTAWETVNLSTWIDDPAPSIGVHAVEYDESTGNFRHPNYWWELLPRNVKVMAWASNWDEVTFQFCNVGKTPSQATDLWLYTASWQYGCQDEETGERLCPIPDADMPDPHPQHPLSGPNAPPQSPPQGALHAVTRCEAQVIQRMAKTVPTESRAVLVKQGKRMVRRGEDFGGLLAELCPTS